VLDRPIGTRPNAGVADALLEDTGIREAVRGDTMTNRAELNPGDQLPIGAGLERGSMVQGPEVSQFGDFERRRNVPEEPMAGFGRLTSNDDIGQMIGRERAGPGPTRTLEEIEGRAEMGPEDTFTPTPGDDPNKIFNPKAYDTPGEPVFVDRVPDSPDASVQATIDRLREMGWSDVEIAQLLGEG
jgi:hypothetical protein